MSERPTAYRGNDPYVFISYAHLDANRIYPLIQRIQDRGFRVWYDEGLEVGSHWDEAISEHLYNCSCVICFVTGNFLTSQNCLDEIHFAKELNKEPMIVYLDDVTPPIPFQFRYGRLHALRRSMSASDDALLDELTNTETLQCCLAPCETVPRISGMSAHALWMQAYLEAEQGNTEKAILLYRQSAEMGDSRAQYNLACHYYSGDGVEKDYGQAAKWYQAALEGGNEAAAEALEECYGENGFYQEDEEAALKWYRNAAPAGDHRAQGALAVMLWDGFPEQYWDEDEEEWLTDTRYNYPESLKWLEMALMGGARLDLALRLARCYELGTLVPQDNSKALQFYMLAANDPEDPGAPKYLSNFRERISTTMTAEECYQKGRSYIASGRYTNLDQEEAAAWYRIAAEKGHIAAMRDLGVIHYTYLGPNLPQHNYDLALSYIHSAADRNDTDAMYEMGKFYRGSFYRRRDPEGQEKARVWFQRAADRGHSGAKEILKYYSA